MLPALERRHDVLAPTLAGHAGGPPLGPDASAGALADAVEAAMDDAGFATAHLVGSSLGGHLVLHLAARGRAETVVALAPAGGWLPDDERLEETFDFQATLLAGARAAAPHAHAVLASPQGRRRATERAVVNFEHIPVELLAHQMQGAAGCDPRLLAEARTRPWTLDAASIDCPVRIVWGTEDRLLPWPETAARYRRDWLPHADWVVLDDVGHSPQLDVPLETAQLIVGFTGP